jgi:hypothetical protein
MQLFEKYRPRSLDKIAGHAELLKNLQRMLSRKGWDGDAFWIEGGSGQGKTSLANIIAEKYCIDRDIHHIAGADCGVDAIRGIHESSQLSAWGESGYKAFIVDEANAMTPRAIQAWKTVLEPLKPKRLFLFTSAKPLEQGLFGDECTQFGRRVKMLKLEGLTLANKLAWMDHLAAIMKAEGYAAVPKGQLARLLTETDGNLGLCLQKIESTFKLADTPAPDKTDTPKKSMASNDLDAILKSLCLT